MGDNARYDGRRIKLGTCASFYYLRFDQAHLVTAAEFGDVDVPRFIDQIRFRFPFPDEDHVEPGDFDAFRELVLTEVEPPAGVEHTRDHEGNWVAASVVQQRVWENRLVLVCKCAGCGALYRLEDFADAKPIVVALRARADSGDQPEFHTAIADHIAEGYAMDVAAVLHARLNPEPAPEPEQGAPVELTEDEAKVLERAGRNEVTKRLRQILKTRTGRTWSVRGSSGTGWGWIHVDAPAARKVDRRASDEDKALLSEVLGWQVGGSPLWTVAPDPGGYAAALQLAAGQPVTITVHR